MKTMKHIFALFFALGTVSPTLAQQDDGVRYYNFNFPKHTPPPPPPDKTDLSGELDAMPDLIYKAEGFPFACKYGDVAGGISADEFKVHYNLFMLVGEPCWAFAFKYHLTSVDIGSGGSEVRIIPSSDSTPVLDTSGVFTLRVPTAIWEHIHLSSEFRFRLYHLGSTVSETAGESVSIQKDNPGMLGRPGEWGWDVPGSPSWDRVYVSDGFGTGMEWLPWNFLDTERAKKSWKIMCNNGPPYWNNLILSDLKLDLFYFFKELEKSDPQIAKIVIDRLSQRSTPANSYQQDEQSLREAAQSVSKTLQDGRQPTEQDMQAVAQATVANENASPRIRDLSARLTALVKQGGGSVNVQHLENAVTANHTMELFGHFGGDQSPHPNSKSTESGSMDGMIGHIGTKSAAPAKTNAAPANSSLQHILDGF